MTARILVVDDEPVVGVFKDLLFGLAARSRFLLGSFPASVVHLALVEAHGRIGFRPLREARLHCDCQVGRALLTNAK